MPALSLPEPLADGTIMIRERRASDADAFIAALQDPEISRWTLVPENYTRSDWDAWIERSAEQARERRGLHLGIFDGEDRLLGAIGVQEIDWEQNYAEIGYWLAKEARGQGHMARAVRLFADWVHRELAIETIELAIDPENEPSRRVGRAAGFVEEAIKPGPERCGRRPVVPYVSRLP